MNKRVLLLTTPFRPNIGGVETHLDDLISEGTKRKIKFTVITYQPLMTKDRGKFVERGNGYIVYRIPWLRMNLFIKLEKYPILEFFYLFPGLFLGTFVYLVINFRKVKVIHSQGLVAGAIGVILGGVFGKEVIISTHSIYNFPKDSLYSKFVKSIFGKCKTVLCVSKQSKNEVMSLGIPKDKVEIFKLWVDQEVFSPVDRRLARKRLGLSTHKFYCLFVGRLVPVKGVGEVIKVSRMIKKINFLVIGDGPMAQEVKREEDRSSNVIFIGKIENKFLRDYYCASDVLIVPSTHEEGFGRVILEALSCGLPVIGSGRGAIREAINDNVGVIIDITPKNIKNALNGFAKDRIKLKRLADNARDFAVRNYSKKNINMIIKYY